MSNWAGNVVYHCSEQVVPQTLAELSSLVGRSPCVKAVGTGHSFSDICDTNGVQVALSGFNEMVLVGESVKIGAGVTYTDLIAFLEPTGKAIANMPSLPHVSIVGNRTNH